MSSSVNEDQEQRLTPRTEDSNAMTIEFLRARLLAERSVSKTARQRADELAKKVTELEDQLKFVSLQRKKAEKATEDVLAILENHGISDVSEEGFDSSSDREEIAREFNTRNDPLMIKENSYSSSERESCPSTGRSLSWKSTKDSQNSLEKKKYMESVRRRASFSSNGNSAKRVGKSCRRVRRWEARTTEEFQNHSPIDVSNCSYCDPDPSRESPKHDNEAVDMEGALHHQAQLIGQYEEEEKAQREWEEKFREINSATQDSCDLGNHSDVTEERDDMKSPQLSEPSGTLSSNNRDTNQEFPEASFNEEPETSKNSPSLARANNESLQDPKYNNTITCESPAPEFSFPVSKENTNQEISGKKHHESSMPNSHTMTHPASHELRFLSEENSNNLGSVLEALQRAKSSLKQKISSVPLVAGGISGNALFRLPTDHPFAATNRAYLPDIGAQSSFANLPPEISGGNFIPKPYHDPRNAYYNDLFLTVPPGPFPRIGPGVSPQRSLSQPRLNHIDPNPTGLVPSVTDSHSFLPDISFQSPFNEGNSRMFSSSEIGVPPVTRLYSYDRRFGPHRMNR